MFYLAQSYRDIGDFHSALYWYNRRVQAGGWREEVWYAMYQAASMQELSGVDWPEVGDSYLRAYVDRPTRAEPLFEIARHHRRTERYDLGFVYSKMAMNIPYPDDVLFVHKDIYHYQIHLEHAMCCHYLGKYKEAIKTYDDILSTKHLPVRARELVLENREKSLDKVEPRAAVSNRQDKALHAATHLNHQQWSCLGCHDVLGKRVMVRTNSARFAEQARSLLRSFSQPSMNDCSPDVDLSFVIEADSQNETTGTACYVYRDGDFVGYTPSYGKLFQFLEWHFTWSADQATDYLLLHSGAVSKNGAGILLPGASKSGKSSLTLALVGKGYSYYSDEIAAINTSTRELHAFPRAFGIRDSTVFQDINIREEQFLGPDSHDQEPVWWIHPNNVAAKPSARLKPHITPVRYIHPDDLTSTGPREPTPIKYIVFPKYDSGSAAHIESITPENAMPRLVETCRNLDGMGNHSLHLLASLAENAECFSLKSNNLRSSVELIDQLICY